MNLKDETLACMEKHGYTVADITFIGTREFFIPETLFWELSELECFSGNKSEKIAKGLMIAFNDDSWMVRSTYDFSAWWSYEKCPTKPVKSLVSSLVLVASLMQVIHDHDNEQKDADLYRQTKEAEDGKA